MEVKNVIVSILTLLCMTTAGYAQGVKSDDAVKSIKTQPATEGIKVQSQTINPVVSAALIGGKEMRLVDFGDWISGLLQHRKNLKKNKTTAPKTSAAPSILERFSAASGRENKTVALSNVINNTGSKGVLTAYTADSKTASVNLEEATASADKGFGTEPVAAKAKSHGGIFSNFVGTGRESRAMDLGQAVSKSLKNVDLLDGIVKGAANSGRENKTLALSNAIKNTGSKGVLTAYTADSKTASVNLKEATASTDNGFGAKPASAKAKSQSVFSNFVGSGREAKAMDLGQAASKALKNVDLTAGIVKGAATSGRENKASQLGAFIASASHQEEVAAVKNTVSIPDMAETLMQEKANLDNAVKGVNAATASPIFDTKDANAIALGQTLSTYFAKSKQANEKQKVQNLSNISAESKEFYDALLANGKYHELASVIIAVDHTAKPAVVNCNGKKYSYKGKVNDSEVLYVLYSIKKNIAQHTCQKGGCLICNSVMSTYHKGRLVYGVASKVKTDLIASAE